MKYKTELLTLLAETDALFSPLRGGRKKWRPQVMGEIVNRREDFHRIGLPIPRSDGGDGGERKERSRNFDRLEKTGLVVFHRTRGRRSHWKLSDTADWALRRQAGWYDYPEMLTAMLAINALTDFGLVAYHNCVMEQFLALPPDKYTQTHKAKLACVQVEEVLYPALVRDWVCSVLSVRGVITYYLTDAGKQFLNNPVEPSIDWPEYSSEDFDCYTDTLFAAEANLKTIKPAHENHIYIPIGEGDWPDPADRRNLPAILTRTGRVRKPGDMARLILKSMEVKK